MGAEASAFHVLGLKPGADRAAIDDAYRRLIKRYHPDRSGGDAKRAAEINRAYLELRPRREADGSPAPPPGDIGEAIYARRAARGQSARPVRRRPSLWPILLIATAALLYIERERVLDLADTVQDATSKPWRPVIDSAPGTTSASAIRSLDGPLWERGISRAVREAAFLARRGSEEQVAERSRECHRAMRSDPSTEQLDRCAAFDYTVTLVQNRDPVEDGGPFSASAVTARQMAAAMLLSRDFLEIESRLDRIRGRVELSFALPPTAEASGGAQPSP